MQILGNYPNFGQDHLHPHPLQFTNHLTIRRYIQTTALFRKVRRKLNSGQTESSVHMVNYISIYNGVQLKSNSNAVEPDREQHDRPRAYVIAQH